MSGNKSYPVWQFTLEATAITVFLFYVGFYIYSLVFAYNTSAAHNEQLIWKIIFCAFGAYLMADFLSGLAHFLADNFGNPNTPIVGKVFIFAFREHHVDPKAITRHGFVETNGANCLVSLPGLIYFYHSSSETEDYGFRLFIAIFYLSIFLTNQIHKWAHLTRAPQWVVALQRSRIILSREHHDIHHHAPFDKYYCITSGWLNAILQHLHFFSGLKRLLTWNFRRT